MYRQREIIKDIYYVGASDRRLAKFENIYPLNNGVSYNSYLIVDEKTCLLDTVDHSVSEEFFEKLYDVLSGRNLDYLIINHMECDHSSEIKELLLRFPLVTLVTNEKAYNMLKNFNDGKEIENKIIVKEGDYLTIGKHKLTFIMAPMVHWPEVMVTYDEYTKTLFSADAFGTFNALSGSLFADEVDFNNYYLNESRRYYVNIVGKYGSQVQSLLKKASSLDLNYICPLHGPMYRDNLNYIISLYDKWSSYESEVKGALIVYGSIYGNSEKCATIISEELSILGVKDILMYDASKTDKSILVSEAFKYSHLIVVSSTYNNEIFTPVEEFLLDLKYHNFQNKTVCLVQNGTWAPNSLNLMKKIFLDMKNINLIDEASFTIKSTLKSNQIADVNKLANLIKDDLIKEDNKNPLFNLSYGLYLLSLKENNKDNALIINSVSQIAENPNKIMVSINKRNYSSLMLKNTKKCNISILTESTPFEVFERFGFQSGKDTDKFKDFKYIDRDKEGLIYLTKYSNSYLSLEVESILDEGSHLVFILKVLETKILSNSKSLTYSYYLTNIKKVKKTDKKINGWMCKICGFIYEGEELPEDYICPLCKHGVSDFVRYKNY